MKMVDSGLKNNIFRIYKKKWIKNMGVRTGVGPLQGVQNHLSLFQEVGPTSQKPFFVPKLLRNMGKGWQYCPEQGTSFNFLNLGLKKFLLRF